MMIIKIVIVRRANYNNIEKHIDDDDNNDNDNTNTDNDIESNKVG